MPVQLRHLLLSFSLLFSLSCAPNVELYQPANLASDAVLCCDGNDDYTICWRRGLVKDHSDPSFFCLLLHEREHVRYFRQHHPTACVGRPGGHWLFTLSGEEARQQECTAYRLQVRCLSERQDTVGDLWWRVQRYADATYGCGAG